MDIMELGAIGALVGGAAVLVTLVAFHQCRARQLDENIWRRMEYEIPSFLSAPGCARCWAQDKQRFSPVFVEYVDRLLATTPPLKVFPTAGGQSSNAGGG